MTYIVHDNTVYGLTTGQRSPTSDKGFKSKSTPHGSIDMPINPLTLALSAHCTFVARGYAGDPKGLANLILKGIEHKGFALIDVMQPCVTYDKKHTYIYYKDRIKPIENHDASNWDAAYKIALREWGDKIPVGIFYQEQRPTYTEELKQLKDKPIAAQDITQIDIGPILKEFE